MGKKEHSKKGTDLEEFDLSQLEQQFMQEELSESKVQLLERDIQDLNDQIHMYKDRIAEFKEFNETIESKNTQISSLEDIVDSLNQKVDQQQKQLTKTHKLQQKVEELTNKNFTLVAELRDFSTPQATWQDRYKNLQKESGKMEKRLTSSEELMETYKRKVQQIPDLEKQIAKLTSKYQLLKETSDIKKIKAINAGLITDQNELRTHIQELQVQISQLETEKEETGNRFQDQIENLQQSRRGLSAQVKSLENENSIDKTENARKISNLEDQLQTEQHLRISQLQAQKNENNDVLLKHESEIAGLEEEYSDLLKKMMSTQQENEIITNKFLDKIRNQEELNHDIQANFLLSIREIYDLNKKLDTAAAQNTHETNLKEKFESELKATSEELLGKESQILQLQQSLSTSTIQIEHLQKEFLDENTKISVNSEQKAKIIEEQSDKLTVLQAEYETYQNESNKKFKQLEQKLKKVQQKSDSKDTELRTQEKLRSELKENKSILEQMSVEANKLREQKTKATETITELRSKVFAVQSKFDTLQDTYAPIIEKYKLVSAISKKHEQKHQVKESLFTEKIAQLEKNLEKKKLVLANCQAKDKITVFEQEIAKLETKIENLKYFIST